MLTRSRSQAFLELTHAAPAAEPRSEMHKKMRTKGIVQPDGKNLETLNRKQSRGPKLHRKAKVLASQDIEYMKVTNEGAVQRQADLKSEGPRQPDIEDAGDANSQKKNEASKVVSQWEPPLWREQLENIRKMRAGRDAPVDSAGCSELADRAADDKTFRFQILVSLMLSSQTKDAITAAAMTNLKKHGCTAEKIAQTTESDLAALIYPVGFTKQKAKYLRQTAQLLVNDHQGDIPRTVEELLKLPGVGPKMAYLAMLCAWHEVSGIGVDTHVHKICNRLGWVQKATKTPEATRLALEAWLPKELWSGINKLLVGFGQQTCLSVRPRCEECLNKSICPFYAHSAKGKKKQRTNQ